VPFAPGGTTDLTARIIAEQLSQSLKQNFLVENKAGAGGNLGAAEVAKAAPDGYTFLMGTPGTQAINQFLYPRMPYDTAKDLVPVSFVVRVPNVLMVNPQLPAKNIQELLALLKAQPGKLSYGTPGNGSTGHLSTELFKTQAGVFVTHIPYRGSGPAQADFLGNQVPLMVDSLTAALPHIRSKRAVPLAVTSATRSALLPDVPTVGESGVSGTRGFEAVGWLGLMAPKGTPPEVVARLQREVNDALRAPDMVAYVAERGSEVAPTTGPEFDAFVAAEIRKWGRAVKVSGAKPE